MNQLIVHSNSNTTEKGQFTNFISSFTKCFMFNAKLDTEFLLFG